MELIKNTLNLETTRGDTLSFGLELDGVGDSVTAITFTCKENFDDRSNVFQKTLGNGITLDHNDGDDYFYRIRIAPEDTATLELGKYYYDIEVQANHDVFTIAKGVLTITYDVTNGGN